MTRNINGQDVPLMILGDPAYPLLPWLMKGFADNGRLTEDHINFNYRLSRARMVIEGSFGRLKTEKTNNGTKTTNLLYIRFMFQHCLWGNRCNTGVQVNTNKGLERQNGIFKYSFLVKKNDTSISGMISILISEYLPTSIRR